MEQINLKNYEEPNSESVTESTTDKHKSTIERVTLGKDEAEKLNYWLNQIKSETSGFLEVSKSDLVNFLIRNHGEQLKAKEIRIIRSHKYDLVKHLNWLTPLLKKAIELGPLFYCLRCRLISIDEIVNSKKNTLNIFSYAEGQILKFELL
ncbi:MAG: hypothetical protein JNM24_08710 [Bdellovibrionaceae bacterium]|nr:hypothetical protein [Pseudobdellovibrionaceae bacterium]